MPMYTQEVFDRSKKLFQKMVLIYCIVAALVVAFLVVCLIVRISVWFYVVGVLFALFSVFFWTMFAGRARRWYKFQKDMMEGLDNPFSGEITAIAKDLSKRDGLEFIRVDLKEDGDADNATERMLYFDASMQPIPVEAGQHVAGRAFGLYIKEIHIVEGA